MGEDDAQSASIFQTVFGCRSTRPHGHVHLLVSVEIITPARDGRRRRPCSGSLNNLVVTQILFLFCFFVLLKAKFTFGGTSKVCMQGSPCGCSVENLQPARVRFDRVEKQMQATSISQCSTQLNEQRKRGWKPLYTLSSTPRRSR